MSGQPESSAAASPLDTPVQFVPGVGPGRARLLARLNIRTVADLLYHVPHSCSDFSRIRPVPRLVEDAEQSVVGRVVERDSRRLSRGRSLVAVLLDCDGHFVRSTWFNQPWMFGRFREGDRVLFSGVPRRRDGRWEFSSPTVHWITDEDDPETAAGVLPKYALTEGISMSQMRRMTRSAVEQFAEYVVDPLPEDFRTHHRLPELSEALCMLHRPDSVDAFRRARHRLILDDLLEFQLALGLRRRQWSRESRSRPIPVSRLVDSRIRRLFDFRFTDGQNAAIETIVADIARPVAMHRLLQADVGAGKTAVAVYAMLAAVAAGCQTVLMAPTEVLASQHWETLDALLRNSRVRRGLLVGGLPAARRRQLLHEIASGECQLIVGTQAVIQDAVEFRHLALAVIDEQHRFGVRQRARFGRSGRIAPHVLVMTATPIPRSLCLTRFGDLDVSVIRDVPPGRQRVITSLVSDAAQRSQAWTFLRRHIAKGRQAYVVCPRVEGQDSDDDAAAETLFQQLASGELQGLRLGLLHGRMDRQQRHEVMSRFHDHDLDVLVSTTVIEVGINVPNATLMVVQQAERFGLAQLHQLRGRICRGRFQGYCFLFSESDSSEAAARLQALVESADGFELAEKDAALRGPGDVLGTRQSGALPLRCAHPVRDLAILTSARKMAFDLIRTGEFDRPPCAALKAAVLDRFADVLDLPRTG